MPSAAPYAGARPAARRRFCRACSRADPRASVRRRGCGTVATARGHLVPPRGQGRRPLREGEGAKLLERARIHRTLEVDDFQSRFPVRSPAPWVKFRLAGAAESEPDLGALQAQQEPALLLADAHRMLIAPDVARRQPVTQPAVRVTDEFHAQLGETNLFIELAVQGLLGRLSGAHSALGKLPAAPAGAAAEEHLIALHQHDADVAAQTVRIDDVAHRGFSLPQRAPAVTPSRARFAR